MQNGWKDYGRTTNAAFIAFGIFVFLVANGCEQKDATENPFQKKSLSAEVIELNKSAEKGDPEAQFHLGVRYTKGEGLIGNDAEAAIWFRKASDQGHSKAQLYLGLAYAKGRGIEQDDVEAARWYGKAADQGNAVAQYNLGGMYSIGKGVEQDYVKAVKWFRKAVDQGDTDAQYNLGIAYANGTGVEQDDAEAVKWYHKAAEDGAERDYIEAYMWALIVSRYRGKPNLQDVIKEELTAAQIAEATRLAKEFVGEE